MAVGVVTCMSVDGPGDGEVRSTVSAAAEMSAKAAAWDSWRSSIDACTSRLKFRNLAKAVSAVSAGAKGVAAAESEDLDGRGTTGGGEAAGGTDARSRARGFSGSGRCFLFVETRKEPAGRGYARSRERAAASDSGVR